ncbi:MAG: ROK family protein [Anaerolineaceae bacterium]|nr:ROK family protein [Anaerolineaceae bacterium]
MHVLGIDIGGFGIKGALVDVKRGTLVTEPLCLPTPTSAKPEEMALVVRDLCEHFQWHGITGAGFPAVVKKGVVTTAANIHSSWIGVNAENLFHETTGLSMHVLNDADAAGIAEMKFGAGKEFQNNVVILLTLGTGIGSAIFVNGILLPNTEFGHLQIRGRDAEKRASGAAKTREGLSWKAWSKRLLEFLIEMEKLFSPDLFIISGGVSKQTEEFFPYLKTATQLAPAQFFNQAGIVGAAMHAGQKASTS